MCSSVHQVLEFRVDEWEQDCAGSVQDGPTLHQSPRFGDPRLTLKVNVGGVQCHGKEVSDECHGFGCQSEKQKKWVPQSEHARKNKSTECN